MKPFVPPIYKVTTETAFYLSLDVLKLFYDNAQKRLADYQKQANDTTERAYKTLAIYATLLTLLCAYVFTHPDLAWRTVPVWFLLAGTAMSTFWMMKVVMPRNYMPLGNTVSDSQPNEYAQSFTEDGESASDDIQMRLVLRDELNQLEYSIRWQEQTNNRRVRLFGRSLRSILCGICAAMLSYLILLFL